MHHLKYSQVIPFCVTELQATPPLINVFSIPFCVTELQATPPLINVFSIPFCVTELQAEFPRRLGLV
jgi:hypothetical protein